MIPDGCMIYLKTVALQVLCSICPLCGQAHFNQAAPRRGRRGWPIFYRLRSAIYKKYANVIEQRIDDTWCNMDFFLEENADYLKMCKEHNYPYILIDDCYQIEIDL